MNFLDALSPLDGRYLSLTSCLRPYFSEKALIYYRIYIEISYVVSLVRFLNVERISKQEEKKLFVWVKNLSERDFAKGKEIESETKHDVKAVEYFIRKNLPKLKLQKLSPWIHWGVTSEDINNLAFSLMTQKAKEEILLPQIKEIISKLLELSEKYLDVMMPARTHGQIAVPTTLGKELVVFASRLSYFYEKLVDLKLGGKLNGAVGNFNSFQKLYTQKDWVNFSKQFVENLSLNFSLITTQIEPATKLVYMLDLIRQVNNVFLNLAKDCWLYISYDYLMQEVVKSETGSSTMPHKVNPINFENAEGNFDLSNSLLFALSNKFPLSRLQRDLSGSTVMRNIGVAFGYMVVALKNVMRGLQKISPNKELLKNEIIGHPEMMSEALQLYLKVHGQEKAYEKVKEKVRGKKITWEEMISGLPIKFHKELENWKVENYLGLADKITKTEIKRIRKILYSNKNPK